MMSMEINQERIFHLVYKKKINLSEIHGCIWELHELYSFNAIVSKS